MKIDFLMFYFDDMIEETNYSYHIDRTYFDTIDNVWNSSSDYLSIINNYREFKSVSSWSDLSPTQYRILIISSIKSIINNGVSFDDTTNVYLKRFLFLVGAYSKLLTILNESRIAQLCVRRTGDGKYEFLNNMSVLLEKQAKPKKPSLRLVVDNLK